MTAGAASRLSSGELFPPPFLFILSLEMAWLAGHGLTRQRRGINEGRQAAREVDLYLEHSTGLPVTGGIVRSSAQEILHAIHA